MDRPLRIGVVSPFLDKMHGTERCVVEQVERLARIYGCEVVVYSQNVTGIALGKGHENSLNGSISWRKVSDLPGPHLIRFLWWFAANHLVRVWDRLTGRFQPDLVYSPGINCLDADVMSVHVLFSSVYARLQADLSLSDSSLGSWPRLIHRRGYYRLIMTLERLLYRSTQVPLAGVSGKVVAELKRTYGREKNVEVIYHGIDGGQFNSLQRASLRCSARQELGLPDSAFVLLLVGNDWKIKGLATLLKAMAQLQDPIIWALVVGGDSAGPYRSLAEAVPHRVLFHPARSDVEWYYSAADAYVGPSLEDAFALPPLEAMACGIPAIVSRQAGVSELITHGVDGLVLEDPTDSSALAECIRQILSDRQFYSKLAENALSTARKYSWERNTEELFRLFVETRNN